MVDDVVVLDQGHQNTRQRPQQPQDLLEVALDAL